MEAWRRIVDALAEQRASLDHRISKEDVTDTLLERDCQTQCELMEALADYMKAGKE
jgi:hypothetical protein